MRGRDTWPGLPSLRSRGKARIERVGLSAPKQAPSGPVESRARRFPPQPHRFGGGGTRQGTKMEREESHVGGTCWGVLWLERSAWLSIRGDWHGC